MPTSRVCRLPFPVCLLALSFHPSHTFAQTERTSLTGIVVDPLGNRIPQAKVVAVQDATGLKRETETTSHGVYQLPDLPAGLFTIQFSKEGFSTYQIDRVRQVVGQTGTLNVTLSLGP